MSQMTESFYLSSNGVTNLYAREYIPDSEPRGIVQLVHGIAEHIARYDDFARFLCDKGFIVVAHDQLGHGKSITSEAEKGYFGKENGWNLAVDDIRLLHDLTQKKYPGKPYFLLGHSMGSFLVRTYIIRNRTGLDGVIISGTGQQPGALLAGGKILSQREVRRHGPTYKSEFLNKLCFGGYNDGFDNPRTISDWLSRDEAVVDIYNADPLCGYIPSAQLVHDMLSGIEFIGKSKNMARMKKDLPVLFFSGEKDPVGEQGKGVIKTYKGFISAGMQDVTLKLYPDGRHEMLNEINKDEVYQDVLFWLNSKSGNCGI